jgi:hypothetical protein
MRPSRACGVACALVATCTLSGCVNPDAPGAGPGGETGAARTAEHGPGSPGEPTAPTSPTPASQQPAAPVRTPRRALEQFAGIYINWSYLDLQAKQRKLAAMSVGAARLAEQQAALASEADPTIREGHIHNSGQTLAVSENLQEPGEWVIVTREETAGNSSYQGLPASLHVTLARVAQVPGGYAVSEWLPQS